MTLKQLHDKLTEILDSFGADVADSEVTLARDPEGNRYYDLYQVDPGKDNTILWPGGEVEFDEQGA